MNRFRLLGVVLAMGVLLLSLACSGGDPTRSGGGNFRLVMSTTGGSSTLGAGSSEVASEAGDSGVALAPSNDNNSGGDALRRLQELNVTFASFLARNLNGELIDVNVDLPLTVDLLAIREDRSLTLPGGSLPPGTYDQIVVVMTAVELVLLDDTRVEITPPGGGWTAIIPGNKFLRSSGADKTSFLQATR